MVDRLVTISGFVEGRLVRLNDSQEVLFSARQLAESPVDRDLYDIIYTSNFISYEIFLT